MSTICLDILTWEKTFGTSKFEVLFEFSDWSPNHWFWYIAIWQVRSGHPLTWGDVVHLTQNFSFQPGRSWKLCSGSVQQTQKLMTGLKNLKTKPFYLFPLLYPHHMHSPPKSDIFPHEFFTCFSWKSLTMPLYYSWGSKKHMQRAEGREPGRTRDRPFMVPAWPSLVALTGGTGGMLMPCNFPPQLEGRRGI